MLPTMLILAILSFRRFYIVRGNFEQVDIAQIGNSLPLSLALENRRKRADTLATVSAFSSSAQSLIKPAFICSKRLLPNAF